MLHDNEASCHHHGTHVITSDGCWHTLARIFAHVWRLAVTATVSVHCFKQKHFSQRTNKTTINQKATIRQTPSLWWPFGTILWLSGSLPNLRLFEPIADERSGFDHPPHTPTNLLPSTSPPKHHQPTNPPTYQTINPSTKHSLRVARCFGTPPCGFISRRARLQLGPPRRNNLYGLSRTQHGNASDEQPATNKLQTTCNQQTACLCVRMWLCVCA